MVLCFSNNLSLSIGKDINILSLFIFPALSLNVSTYPLLLGNIKTSALITSFKYPIKYLELFSVSTNFEMTILSTSISQVFIGYLHLKIPLLLLLSYQIL